MRSRPRTRRVGGATLRQRGDRPRAHPPHPMATLTASTSGDSSQQISEAENLLDTLVLDPTLAGPLSLVTEVSLLKWVKLIAATYTLLLVPRTSTLVTRILEEEGVLGDITISFYNLQFIPIAEDVISLENDNAFKELWVDGDETVIYNSMQALDGLQRVYGPFPRIVGKGDYASRLANLLHRNPPTSSPSTSQAAQSPIDSLIIIDRGADMITPLLTQLTYEGLIDESFGIKNVRDTAHVEPNAASSSTPPNPTSTLAKEKQKKHHLTTATDPLFVELRRKLNQVARRLDEDYKLRHQAKTPAQLRDFSEHQSLRLHTGLSEMLFNKSLEIQQNLLASYDIPAQLTAIEELIAQGQRCSIISGGIKAKTLENMKREILQAYGYNLLPLLLSLSAPPLCILLPTPLPPSAQATSAATKYPYAALRKSLRLLIEDPDNVDDLENDISYVYSGYAPISVRLVQWSRRRAAREQAEGLPSQKSKRTPLWWKGFEDVAASIPAGSLDGASATASSLILPRDTPTTTLVFFLGGCTYTEIAALRWVGRQNKGRKFLVATTGIISGASLIEGIAGVDRAAAHSKDAAL
ncbi:Sec1-like protein [Fomitopsis serialis]|uniref:Sec1-like protein n=1 Tax=Fomitopsis serialis TaxID=139415 RepID=UPI002007992A|nr:Sec1-like protein [Neoantrodia serialis]KAH9929757.1 Sec1-like protein [Neoantrodia serialis]